MRTLFRSIPTACMLSLAGGLAPGAGAAPPLEYNRDIRPILSNNCFQCHGPDKNKRKAEMRLDIRDEAVRKKAIVPGKPDESNLVARIFAESAEDVMPPPESHKKLDLPQKEKLKRWVAEGAPYSAHWAYVPVRRFEPPQPKRAAWVRNPIDAFILGALEAQGLEPSREAEKRRLLRRLSLDLIGLPPEPGAVESFAADSDSRAYERLVDGLLDSPHFGERMAVPWLDLVRFSDSVGYHGDQLQRVFPYRDYVIDAFNKNLPFDRFTIEQIAGDLLPEATTEQLVATGFNRLNMVTREGGAQPKEYLAKYASDRVRTVAITWLGSTMGCCECHDHKYDPFTARDFYSLAAFFADVKQWGVYQDYPYTPNPDLAGWSNDHPFPPEVEVRSSYLERRKALLEARICEIAAAADVGAHAGSSGESLEAWRQDCLAFLKLSPTGWSVPALEEAGGGEPQGDGSVLFSLDPKPNAERKLVTEPGAGWVAAIRLEALPHEKNGGSIVRGGGSSASIRLAAVVKRAGAAKDDPLSFAFAEADAKEPSYFNGEEVAGVQGGWRTAAARAKDSQAAVWILSRPVRMNAEDRLVVSVRSDKVGCVRLAVSPFVVDFPRQRTIDVALQTALTLPPGARSAAQDRILQVQHLLGTAWDVEAHARARAALVEELECGDSKTFTVVTRAVAPLTTRILRRGNWQDESGPIVEPAVPGFLPQPGATGRRLTRLDLARWITSPENPLAARVLVNRLWKLFFGAGLCASVDDLGAQGEPPSHPELLDWLASELVKSGWDVKHMVKLIVLSSTYRQDSSLRPELRDIDPQNRLLSSQNPRRLEAEFVRDNALSIAGLINLDVGGPSARPYQPGGYYANLQFPDREYDAHTDDRQYRRGVYMHWQRTFLHPMLANFDAPPREECTAMRVVSNTPQQALTLLNDPSFVEAARALAGRLLSTCAGGDEERLDFAFRRALARAVADRERPSLLALLRDQRAYYAANTGEAQKLLSVGLAPNVPGLDPAELASWTHVCRVILNLHETITRY